MSTSTLLEKIDKTLQTQSNILQKIITNTQFTSFASSSNNQLNIIKNLQDIS